MCIRDSRRAAWRRRRPRLLGAVRIGSGARPCRGARLNFGAAERPRRLEHLRLGGAPGAGTARRGRWD
eukprot:83827-Pyramimonas_sp.AAC.1